MYKGSRRQAGQEREGKNSGDRDMRSVEGRGPSPPSDGYTSPPVYRAGYTGETGWTLQRLSGPYTTRTFMKESREFEGGGFRVD